MNVYKNRSSHSASGRKLLIYSSNLLPYSETFIKQQILSLHGWNPVLIGERYAPDGLSLKDLNHEVMLADHTPYWRELVFRIFRKIRFPDPFVMRRMRLLYANVIHAHFGTSAVDFWPYAERLGLPFFVTLHGFDITIHKNWWESGHGGRRRVTYPQQLLNLAGQPTVMFIAVSEAIKLRAQDFGIPENKIKTHYIGVDTEQFTPGDLPIPKRKKRILFIGRLVEKKGISLLIESIYQLNQSFSDVELIIVGDGELKTELQNQVEHLKINNITFKGALSPAMIKNELNQARVLCLPSITAKNGDSEGFGMVLLEAQASGVPVVSSARGGSEEGIVQGITGFKFQEGNVGEMSLALQTILSDDKIAHHMSLAARSFVQKKFCLQKCTHYLDSRYLKQMT
ncbi:glycosyltransferase [Desulfosediminicola flagellatus]|uniref:glycosyltransferase n=1 Tax=Desulfosediminicola flagellatus TaxID=2569541 RepID=UPI0010ABAA3C|nr:glycosyltransferase [Desulfosediminicola flagellatus]